MARRKKGRDISGWVIVDKPAGLSSAAVVNKVRWAFDAKKAGHAGTLDPEATGILAVALGEATKTVPYVTDALKAYEFVVRFGIATNTDDAEGEAIHTSDTRPDDSEIEAALPQFVGDIMQVPPQFSAVKIDGVRAYKLARDGEAADIEPRPLYVEELAMDGRSDPDHATLYLVCGKGGYVRSIARDLGEFLGCYAHVQSLRRVWSGPFDLEQSVSMEKIEAVARSEQIFDLLRPLEIALEDLPETRCDEVSAARLRNGNPGHVIARDVKYGDLVWASCVGKAVAIGHYRAGELHPMRVILPSEIEVTRD